MMLMYFLILFGTMGLALAAQAYLKSVLRRYGRVAGSSGYTGAQVAAEVLRRNGITEVTIHEHPSFLGDHYDPLHKRLVLSSDVYHGNSLAALGVAAHEAGHAIQHKTAYAPLHLRMAAVGITNFANTGISYLFIMGMLSGLGHTRMWLALMAICWGVVMLFNLITLPVEYDASRRAKDVLNRLGFVRSPQESAGVAKVLNAAALTYVAAFITSLLYLLLYLLPLLLGGRSRD